MRTSEQITTIAGALLKAQAMMGFAKKGATNPHFKSKYADLPEIVDAIKAPLNDNGIVFLQGASGDSAGVTVTTRLLHSSGEWIEETMFLPVPQQTAQAYGSAVTYGRRYGLQALVGLPADDDDGNKASEKKEAPVPDGTAVALAKSVLTTASGLDALQEAWKAIPADLRKLPELQEAKDKKKADFLAAQEERRAA